VDTVDDDAIRALVTRLARPHSSGGKVIERAAILAEGTDSAAVMAWITAHAGIPEATVATPSRHGLHGSRNLVELVWADVDGHPRQPPCRGSSDCGNAATTRSVAPWSNMPTKRYSRFMKPVTKQKRIPVRVDPDLAEALKECACREKRSVSEVVRTTLREYLDRAT
jgi:hypothetical protein